MMGYTMLYLIQIATILPTYLYIYIYVYYIILYIYHILLYILIFIVLPTDVGAFFGHLSRLNHSFSMVELQDQDQQEHALATQKFSKK
jgi:hypothetical protein